MRYIVDEKEKDSAERHINEAQRIARKGTCERAQCGSVVVKDGEIIGRGFNSPAGNDERTRRCGVKKDSYHAKVVDNTCCVHAEERAIFEALRNHPDKLPRAALYFSRFYVGGRQRLMGGKIQFYCSMCAKMMFDVGITEFILPHQKGIAVYPTEEVIERSFNYGKEMDD